MVMREDDRRRVVMDAVEGWFSGVNRAAVDAAAEEFLEGKDPAALFEQEHREDLLGYEGASLDFR
jgi:hypothetical protein